MLPDCDARQERDGIVRGAAQSWDAGSPPLRPGPAAQ